MITNLKVIHSKAKSWLIQISHPFQFDTVLIISVSGTCKQVQQLSSREDNKVFLGLCHGCDASWGKIVFKLTTIKILVNQKITYRNDMPNSNLVFRPSFGQNGKTIKNSIDKALVNNYILYLIAWKAILE